MRGLLVQRIAALLSDNAGVFVLQIVGRQPIPVDSRTIRLLFEAVEHDHVMHAKQPSPAPSKLVCIRPDAKTALLIEEARGRFRRGLSRLVCRAIALEFPRLLREAGPGPRPARRSNHSSPTRTP